MGGGTGGCLGNWLCNLKQILMKRIKTVGAPRVIQTFFFTMLNIAKYCVRYLWDCNWSPIHSPTFTVKFFPLFHLILITNRIGSVAQFINKSRVSSCEDVLQEEYPVQKRSCVDLPIPESINAAEKGRAGRRDWPSRDAASWFPCSAPERLVAQSSSPCTRWGCSAEDFHPNRLILSGWSSQLGSWMRLSPSRITKATTLLKDIQPFVLVWISMGELLGNDLTHPCHRCRCSSEVKKGYLNYVYVKEF